MPELTQGPDGRWTPAVPLGWQGTGLDWEVMKNRDGYTAELLHHADLLAVVRSRSRLVLGVKMLAAARRARTRGPSQPTPTEEPT